MDLYTPETNPTGILDSMGVAHMIGAPGTAEEISGMGPRFPLMSETHIALFGYGPADPNSPERRALSRYEMPRYPAEVVQGRARAAAASARADVEQRAERILVHFDVDVIDFFDVPIADVPQHGLGLTFADAMASLSVFTASPKFAGLVITEFNPDHADEEGLAAATLAQGIADALSDENGTAETGEQANL